MFLTAATIGRNVKGQPMSDQDWQLFRDLVEDTIRSLSQYQTGRYKDSGFSRFTGLGHWMGVPEESATFQLVHESEIDGLFIDLAKDRLKALAEEFGQDAIAFNHHIESHLIMAV